jgi:hypothetical protein
LEDYLDYAKVASILSVDATLGAASAEATASLEGSTTAGAEPTSSMEAAAGKSSKGLMVRVKECVEQL